MNRDVARQMLPVVNDKDVMDRLKTYAAYRIEQHRDNLEKQADPEKVWRLQDRIAELRRFETLREEVLNGAK